MMDATTRKWLTQVSTVAAHLDGVSEVRAFIREEDGRTVVRVTTFEGVEHTFLTVVGDAQALMDLEIEMRHKLGSWGAN
jgi:hypothetical protein